MWGKECGRERRVESVGEGVWEREEGGECGGRSVGERGEYGGSQLIVYVTTVLMTVFLFSARKRMSVVVRTPDGTIKLFCKGAVSQLKAVVLALCQAKEQGCYCVW